MEDFPLPTICCHGNLNLPPCQPLHPPQSNPPPPIPHHHHHRHHHIHHLSSCQPHYHQDHHKTHTIVSFHQFSFFFGVFDLHLFSSIDCDRIVIIISQRPWQLVESSPWLLCRSKCLTICRQQHHDSSKLPDVIPKSGVQVPVGNCWRTYMRTF